MEKLVPLVSNGGEYNRSEKCSSQGSVVVVSVGRRVQCLCQIISSSKEKACSNYIGQEWTLSQQLTVFLVYGGHMVKCMLYIGKNRLYDLQKDMMVGGIFQLVSHILQIILTVWPGLL